MSLYDQYLPSCENFGSVQALRMISTASSKRARDSAIGTPYTLYSRGTPRAKPERIRPRDIVSAIASSSAMRSGLCSGTRLPSIRNFNFFVRCAATAAIMFGEFIMPCGVV